jgi:hypothetical protein
MYTPCLGVPVSVLVYIVWFGNYYKYRMYGQKTWRKSLKL